MKCHHFLQKHCLSCDLLSLDYSSSILKKEQTLLHLFPQDIDKLKASVVCEHRAEGSRNKAKLAVTLVNGEIEFGFYENNMQFKKLEDCPLHAPAINAVLPVLKKQLSAYDIVPYDVLLKKGELKYLLITYSKHVNELLLRFVLRSKESIHRLKKLTQDLVSHHSMIKVVTANIQCTHQAILEGDEEIILTDHDCITHRFDEYFIFQGSRSFFQTNSEIALQLYRQFQKQLSDLSIHSFLDLYCGVGAFSFFAGKHCVNVVGVEISDAAIFYANKAREKNNSAATHFLAMDVEAFLKDQQSGAFDAVMVNPPRRGLNDSIVNHLIRLAPRYLFYSSCNAETLKRDILLLEKQYQIQSLQMFDMFPFTHHFETLAVLTRA